MISRVLIIGRSCISDARIPIESYITLCGLNKTVDGPRLVFIPVFTSVRGFTDGLIRRRLRASDPNAKK